jgi:hypothetical protein
MAVEKSLIDSDIFQRFDRFAFLKAQHSVDQQNWIAMRQHFEYLMYVHGGTSI